MSYKGTLRQFVHVIDVIDGKLKKDIEAPHIRRRVAMLITKYRQDIMRQIDEIEIQEFEDLIKELEETQ